MRPVIQFFFLLIVISSFFTECGKANKSKQKSDINRELSFLDSLSNVDPVKADSLGLIVLKKAFVISEDSTIARSYYVRTGIYINLGKLDSANACVKKGLDYCSHNKMELQKLLFDVKKGTILLLEGDYLECTKTLKQALPGLLKFNEYRNYVKAQANIGWAFFNTEQFELALPKTREAMSLALKYGYSDIYSEYQQRMGSIFGQMKAMNPEKPEYYDSAVLYFKRYESDLVKINNPIDIAYYFNNMGSLNLANLRNDSAIYYLRKATVLFKQYNLELDLGFSYANMGLAFQRLKKYDSAFIYQNLASEIAIKTNNTELQTTTVNNLAVLQSDRKYFQSSNAYFKKYFELFQKQINEKILLSNRDIYVKLEVEKKEKENALLLSNKLTLEKRNLRNIFSSIGVISLLIFGMFYYLKRRNNLEKLREKEAEKQREIAVLTAGENERKRIAKDLHDNLGAYASAILSATSKGNLNAASLEYVNHSAQQIIQNLKETVSVLNNEEITFAELVDAFKTTAIRLLKNYPEFTFTVKENFAYNGIMNVIQNIHIKSILNELLQNTIKHSMGSAIVLEILENDETVTINYSDNGIGYNWQSHFNGNGIRNILSRSVELNLDIDFVAQHTNKCVLKVRK
jgi:signal transduction histidine kinase